MQHLILILAMLLLLAVAGKELNVAKVPADHKLIQVENVQQVKTYELQNDEDDDIYNTEFNVGSCYTDLFQ